jgi:hypothetical protein
MAKLSNDDIIKLSQKYGLPPELAFAVYNQESSSGANTKDSPKGAKGPFQVEPATFRDMKVGDNVNDPMQNAEAGIKYLAQGYQKTGSYEGAAGYYHAGPDWINKLAKNPDLNDGKKRTKDYMSEVAAKATELKDRFVGGKKVQPTEKAAEQTPTMGIGDELGTESGSDLPYNVASAMTTDVGGQKTKSAQPAPSIGQEDTTSSGSDLSFNMGSATIDLGGAAIGKDGVPIGNATAGIVAGTPTSQPTGDESSGIDLSSQFTPGSVTPASDMGVDVSSLVSPEASNAEVDEAIKNSRPAAEQIRTWKEDHPTGQVEDIMTKVGGILEDIITGSNGLSASIKDNLGQQVAGIQKEGELAATVATEKFRIENSKAAANAAELSRLGLNTDDHDSLVAQISTRMRDNYIEATRQRQHIRDMQGVGILDNPLAYVVNQMALPSTIADHNRIVEDIAADRNFVDQARAVAQDVETTNATKYASTTAAGAAAAADLARTHANVEAMKVKDQLLKTDLGAQIDKLHALDSAARTMESIAASQERVQQKKTAEQTKAEAEAQQKVLDERIRTAAQILGFTVGGQKELLRQPKSIRDAIETVTINGGDQISKTPLEASELLRSANKSGMTPGLRESAGTLENIRKEAENELAGNQQFLAGNKEQKILQMNQVMQRKFAELANNPNKPLIGIGGDTKASFYKVPDIDIMASSRVPDAQNLRLTKLLVDQKKMLPNVTVTDNLLRELVIANIGKEGGYKDVSEAAKDIATYYRAGMDVNNKLYRFSTFGLPDQTNYPSGGVDMASSASVQKALLKNMADRMRGPENPFYVLSSGG